MTAEYEAGDINLVDVDDVDDDVNNFDVDTTGEDAETAAMPAAVLTYLARSLAENPDAVTVTTEGRANSVRLSLSVDPGDMGRVIGRRGRTAQAMRTLVAVAGARVGASTSVDIIDG